MSEHIDYRKFSRGESCTAEGCRSKRYYEQDGRRICDRGHVQEGFTQIERDEDDWNTEGKKTRRKREEIDKVSRIFSGKEAIELYLQCWQYILWRQVYWLIHTKSFPAELETVVRDLWEVRLGVMKRKGRDNWEAGEETETVTSTHAQMQDGLEEDNGDEGMDKKRKGMFAVDKLPTLPETVATCFLGMLLMQLPVSMADVYGWVEREEIDLIRAIRFIPQEMKNSLPGGYWSAFEAKAPLKPGRLQQVITDLASFYTQNLEMTFPAVNYPLLAFKHVRTLALPIDIYSGSCSLARFLDYKFTLDTVSSYREAHVYPETQLVTLIVIATKLSQSLDGVKRAPEDQSEPATLQIDWSLWQEEMKEAERDGLRPGSEVYVDEGKVMNMTGKELDDYLDWYQRMWVDEEDRKMPEQILNLFPLHELSPPEPAPIIDEGERLKKIHGAMIRQKPVTAGDEVDIQGLLRPGSQYECYKSEKDLSEAAKAFYEAAAKSASISLPSLIRSVYVTEKRLHLRILKERRRAMEVEP